MKRGFTLIEMMICIAILTIAVAAMGTAGQGLRQLRREGDFRFAVQCARQQLAKLEEAPFDSLPPQVLVVTRAGELQLGQRHIVPGSLKVTRLDGQGAAFTPSAVEGRLARVDKSLAGQRVVVDFEWYLPGSNEAELVGPGGRVPLWNAPAVEVEGVRSARGAAEEQVSHWKLSPDRTSLLVSPALEGRAVLIDYLGSRLRNRARGRFLDEEMRPLDRPSPIKLLELREDYGDGAGTFRLNLVRVNR